MIEIKMNDDSTMEFHGDHIVDAYRGWLYVYKKKENYGKELKYLIPMNSVKLVSFD